MNKNKCSAELKSLAKGQLLGRYGIFITAELIYGLIVTAILLFTMFHVDLFSAAGTLIYYAIMFLVSVMCCIFTAGFTYMYLITYKGGHCLATDVFHGFKNHADKIIIIGFILNGISYLLMLPYTLCFQYFEQTQDALFFLIGCILLVIGEALSLYISITFALTYFIVLDFPGYSAVETLRLSHQLMRGHKGRYFYISLSFVPLGLLCMITCGIAYLWLSPYMGMTYTNFYMDLMQSKQTAHNEMQENEPA
ncbi:MAG: DUF975 family protein [Lachnospiraceae bacterium]|nr:DUF975 family protein [Lachnospiraceae bacterium]